MRKLSPTNICTQEFHIFPVVSNENKSERTINDVIGLEIEISDVLAASASTFSRN